MSETSSTENTPDLNESKTVLNPPEASTGPVEVVRDARSEAAKESDAATPPKKKPKSADSDTAEKRDAPSVEPSKSDSPQAETSATGKDGAPEGEAKSSGEKEDAEDKDGESKPRRGRSRSRDSRRPKKEARETSPVVLDEERLKQMAWRIYRAEVAEEGLALLDTKSMRDMARSSFQAARVFLEEEDKLQK